jgi:iron complex transport system permease protein
MVGLGVVALLVAMASLSLGAVDIPIASVVAVVTRRLGLPWLPDPGNSAEAVVWGLRMPRVLLGFAVGGALAVTGAALQGMLRNEMAAPHILGIGQGAAIGAALGTAFGGQVWSVVIGAISGVVTALVVRRIQGRTTDSNRMILAGVALGAALSAWVGFIVFASDRSRVPPVEFWILGGLSGSTWKALAITLCILLPALTTILLGSRALDLLRLGDSDAFYLGLDSRVTTRRLFVAVGATVGATVGVAGVVIFVGLLVPFFMRRVFGAGHRRLMPASLLGGGVFLMTCDLVSRLLLEPTEIPVGLVTAAIGGPLFLWLVSRWRVA